MPPKASNQYDFIMKEQRAPKKPLLSLPDGDTPTKKIAMIVGVVVVILFFFFLMSFIISRGGEDKAQIRTLLQQQTELSRIAGLGVSETSASESIKNTSVNVLTVTTSDNVALTNVLATKKITFKPKDLAKATSTETDQRLADAKAAANFNTMYMSILNDEVTNYQNVLQQTYNATKSKSVKESIQKSYTHAEELKKQIDTIRL